jgi:hypothetical protein
MIDSYDYDDDSGYGYDDDAAERSVRTLPRRRQVRAPGAIRVPSQPSRNGVSRGELREVGDRASERFQRLATDVNKVNEDQDRELAAIRSAMAKSERRNKQSLFTLVLLQSLQGGVQLDVKKTPVIAAGDKEQVDAVTDVTVKDQDGLAKILPLFLLMGGENGDSGDSSSFLPLLLILSLTQRS